MEVVEDVMEYPLDDAEPEPTWDEAVAAFEAGRQVDLVRSPRKLIIEYRYADGSWHATSPDLASFEMSGSSLYGIRQQVKAELQDYLDPAVTLAEQVPDEAETVGASRSQVLNAPAVITDSTSVSRNRTAVSPTRLISA